MKRQLLFFSLFSLAALVWVWSCKKEIPDTDTISATDNSLCEGEFNRVMPEANTYAIGDPGVNGHRVSPEATAPSCPVAWVDPLDTLNGWPNTMYLQYGTSCVCADGKIRSGTLRCVFDTAWDSPNPTMRMYLENYYVNGVHFEGTITINKNRATRTFTKTMNNGKCSNSSWTILYNFTRSVQWVAGYNTPLDHTDDIFTVSGSANGTDRNANTFTVNITSPLEKKGNCRWITKGIVDITPGGKTTRTVDFGDGTCDDKATLRIGNSSFTFTLQ